MSNIQSIPNETPEQIHHKQLRIVLHGMLIARKKLEEGGVRHSWFDPYVQVIEGEIDKAARKVK
jgi:hypothetical protein